MQKTSAHTEKGKTMSKYYKVEDIINFLNVYCPKDMWEYQIINLPTIEVSEEDELKFYYVESIDDYWIGQRLDNFYYAKWNSKLGFVWSASRYLPWGEHVVNEQTLWKEHTYPSEPREIPFTEWIVGFMKKYGSKVSEDCISREWVLKAIDAEDVGTPDEMWRPAREYVEMIKNAPSVVPTAYKLSEMIRTNLSDNGWLCKECWAIVEDSENAAFHPEWCAEEW